MLRLLPCITIICVFLASLYVIADITEVWTLFRQAELPSALTSHPASEQWQSSRKTALIHCCVRSICGLISLVMLYTFIQGRKIAAIYRCVEMCIPRASAAVKSVSFWGWWTLLGFLFESFGLNLNGWRLDRPLGGRSFLELPVVLVTEVTFAILFMILVKKVGSRLVGIVIFAIAGMGLWLALNEYQVRSLSDTKPLVKELELAQAERIIAILEEAQFEPTLVRMAGVPASAYVRGLCHEFILYNPLIKYNNFRQTEAILHYALSERSLGRTVILHYVSNLSYYLLRSVMAFGVLSWPRLIMEFGLPTEMIIGALAIGDLLMSSMRYAEEPFWLWFGKVSGETSG